MNTFQAHSDRNEERENILGQFIYAFGQGAGSIRVSRGAIAALRRRYAAPVQSSMSSWDTTAAYVLPLLGQVGRLAALLATQAGRPFIAEADFTLARRQVEHKVHQDAEQSGRLIAGPFCPATPEDLEPATVPASEPVTADTFTPVPVRVASVVRAPLAH